MTERRQQGILFAGILFISLGWLSSIFLSGEDRPHLLWLGSFMWSIVFSAAHLIVGLLVMFFSRAALFSPLVAFCLIATPFVHCCGAAIEWPHCIIPFIAPTIVTVTLASFELRGSK